VISANPDMNTMRMPHMGELHRRQCVESSTYSSFMPTIFKECKDFTQMIPLHAAPFVSSYQEHANNPVFLLKYHLPVR
jgi:hypothetical protein